MEDAGQVYTIEDNCNVWGCPDMAKLEVKLKDFRIMQECNGKFDHLKICIFKTNRIFL
jgi:hypothetical protein